MKIYKNSIPNSLVDEIETVFSDDKTVWRYSYATVYGDVRIGLNDPVVVTEKTVESPQFVHGITIDGKTYSDLFFLPHSLMLFVEQVCNFKVKQLNRVKINMMMRDSTYPDDCYNTAHIDHATPQMLTSKWKNVIYYINNTDGDTFFFNETVTGAPGNNFNVPRQLTLDTRVSPERGSFVLFDANKIHASSPPKSSANRLVMNILFEIE
jgi:hypothetical protein